MSTELPKAYNPQDHEGEIYRRWQESGFFNPDNLPDRTEPFTIVMPPPNANGDLHAGHALFITLEDIMTRYARMRGKKALWIPGADHAGFETQIVYEKKLEKEGRSRFEIPRDQLYQEIFDFTQTNKENMYQQIRQLGASCDWSRAKFTLDPDVVVEVQKTFVRMFDDGLVYRGKRIINWCTKHQTSLSDVETEFIEKNDPFYYLQYGPFVIATARPETKFGDKYVVMHPDDPRYSQYKNGEKITLEWINGPITATIIKDDAIDPAFGTGVMTITPWHDAIDFDIAQRHQLDKEQIIDLRGKLLPIAGKFAGMKISEARAKIVEKLKEKGLLVKIDESYKHNVRVCYKCETAIEPQIQDQWFVRMASLAEKALDSVKKGEIKFIPDRFEKVFSYWMEHSIDWNISRQIIWGIRIPAMICDKCGQGWPESQAPQTCPECSDTPRPDNDTFDTWFSSGQWPLLTLGYPNGKDFKNFYPTSVMESGYDLIFKWIPRMVIFGLYLADNVPFRTVYLHGLVNDAQGKKMSKSKGNVISPIELTEQFGTDALRMALIVGNTPGMDLALAPNKIKGYKHFANKLWNIARFILMNNDDTPIEPPKISEYNQKHLAELNGLVAEVTDYFEKHRYHLAAETLYHYVWHTFADKVIEESKTMLQSEDTELRASARWTLMRILRTCLILLHPFMPFVTEAIWSHIDSDNLLIIQPWPEGVLK